MKMSMTKKLMFAALVASLVTPVVGASAATPPAKKITVAQGKKIYDKAVKATNVWLGKTAHTTTTRTEDRSSSDKRVYTSFVTLDIDRNIFISNEGEKTYLIGDTLYAENVDGQLADYEIEIAEDLGLNLQAKYAVMHPMKLFPDYPMEEMRQAYSEVQNSGFNGSRDGAKTTAVTYQKSGTTEILTVTLIFAAEYASPAAKRVQYTKIERGIITAMTESQTSAGQSYKVTTTYKAFTGKIAAPEGPYLEWDKVYLDPRYGKLSDTKIAGLQLNSHIREALALAAFDGVEKPTIAIWKTVAEDNDSMIVYDKGIEFAYTNGSDEQKLACGVFNDTGADLEMTSCAELGFTKL